MRSGLEKEIKDYILAVRSRGGSCPSLREIARYASTSKSTVQRYLADMERRGELSLGEFGYGEAHSLGVERAVPILGGIMCGAPSEEFERVEGYVKLPESLLGRGDYFFLKAVGTSMINAGINDGDLVLIRRANEACDGDIVVALVENEVTLKRIFRDEQKKRIILRPENDNMQDIISDGCAVQGVAVKVLKDL